MRYCNKTGNIRVDVAFRRVRVSTVVVEKQLAPNSTIVCVCVLTLVTHHANSMHRFILCLAVPSFSTWSHKRHHFRERVIVYKQGRPLPMAQPGQSEQLAPRPPVNKNLPHTWNTNTFSCTEITATMLQCYLLTCGRAVTAFSAPPRSRRPGQGRHLPHPKSSPGHKTCVSTFSKLLSKHFLSWEEFRDR
jgi:hypothetical protein